MRSFTLLALSAFCGLTTAALAETVPGTSDPWLAGMPDGSTASTGDLAPGQSPVNVLSIPIVPGQHLVWSASGIVGHPGDDAGPDGAPGGIYPHFDGAQNGISTITAPIDSLLGVFLGASQPDGSAAPVGLDFSSSASWDYLSLAPTLKQVFFMGDGRTSGNAIQEIIVPAGATRLFLGTMDGYGWWNNTGSFSVDFRAKAGTVPDQSSSVFLMGVAMVGLGIMARRWQQAPATC